jgi:hypothetical protein
MGMQRVPVREAFYETCFFGNRRQMPTMQKYGVYSNSLRRPGHASLISISVIVPASGCLQ